MRQSALQVDSTAAWKQEVNRRLAEHNERKNAGANVPQTEANTPPAPGSRAAAAAARVAARYAKAPSYSEMLAEEARAAVRAAEAASKAALDAQAAAESVLAGLEAASSATPTWEVEFFTPADAEPAETPAAEPAAVSPQASIQAAMQPAAQPAVASSARQSFAIRWDADLPIREAGPAAGRASHGKSGLDASIENARQTEAASTLEAEGFEVVEGAQPIHANLIEFPRELVATRKVRPRRAEGPYAESLEALGQLSIFEVDPRSISTEPEAAGVAVEAGTATWVGPDWSGIELDEEPQEEMAVPAPAAAAMKREAPAAADATLQVASMNRRALAAVVDFSLIASAFMAATLLALINVRTLPSIQAMEVGSAAALALTGAFYLALFFILAKATPGMKYAQLELSTLSGARPTRAQRCRRLGALMLSLLPAGLGVALAIFDEQNLCWHDRLSGTYLRRA
ncbi:MAG: RDD family protein [Terracidiphilus sp.]